jgi:hypothetical protein
MRDRRGGQQSKNRGSNVVPETPAEKGSLVVSGGAVFK